MSSNPYFDHPMVNLSGLAGAYDFTLSWSPKNVFDAAAKNAASGQQSSARRFGSQRHALGF
jgi:uncharacterized protein (TIGR03435 family)